MSLGRENDERYAAAKQEHVQDDAEADAANVCSAVSFVLVFVVVGIPLWWTTTTVYRAALPYAEIAGLRSKHFHLRVNVKLLWVDVGQAQETAHLPKAVAVTLNGADYGGGDSDDGGDALSLMRINLSYETRLVDSRDLGLLLSVAAKGGNGSKIDLSVLRCDDDSSSSAVTIYVLPAEYEQCLAFPFISCESGCSFVSARSEQLIVQDVLRVLKTRINADMINAIVRKNLRSVSASSSLVKSVVSNDSGRRRVDSVPVIKPEYQAMIFFINPEPSSEDVVRQELPDLRLLEKFVYQLSNVTNIGVKSQSLYYVDFPFPPSRRSDSFYYGSSDLPHMINSLEGFMGTFVGSDPVIHLVLFIPPKHRRPLYVLDQNGQKAAYNSFFVAGWGGVIVDNEALLHDASPFVSTKTQTAMISIIRHYFGLDLPHEQYSGAGSGSGLRRDVVQPLCQWEVQKLLYHACAENTASSVMTVTALVSLLEQIPNIVISDAIGDNVRVAVASLNDVLVALESFDIKRAAAISRTAFLNAETAFFDQSLLALLYFPDDQKYAIYVPLFLPVCLPVFLSIFRILSYLKNRRKMKLKEV